MRNKHYEPMLDEVNEVISNSPNHENFRFSSGSDPSNNILKFLIYKISLLQEELDTIKNEYRDE